MQRRDVAELHTENDRYRSALVGGRAASSTCPMRVRSSVSASGPSTS
jgi:hypothetical protein|tara:strand:- start:348 stop:488 length:141 start_codon:yes stop_codon:yes gene_type:complete